MELFDVLKYFASVGKLEYIVNRINKDEIYPVGFTGPLIMNDRTTTIEEWFSIPSFTEENDIWMFENFIDNSFSDEFVHTWPCCSELRMYKFVLGYGSTMPEKDELDDCFEKVCTLKIEIKMNSRDEEILEKLTLIELGAEPLQTVIIPDGCIRC